jgi:preprotein translocase subunit SecF
MTEEKNWYDKSYKLLLLIPLAILLFSAYYLYNFNAQHGDIVLKDVTLTGGTTITVFDQNANIDDVKSSLLPQFPDLLIRAISDFRTGSQKGFILETQSEASVIESALEQYLGYELNIENSSVEFSGTELSQGFYLQLRNSILFAFLFMAIVVFLIFRSAIPSLAVILAALADIVMSLAVVDILGMQLSTAGVIAFLMIIGYSVDTDILLTTRMLKRREGTINERLYGAFKTGVTMTLTSIAALAVAYYMIKDTSPILSQIFSILLIGLSFDLFNTWLANASILKWYTEKKEAH